MPTELKLFKDVQIPDVMTVCGSTVGVRTEQVRLFPTVAEDSQPEFTFTVIVLHLGIPDGWGLLHKTGGS